MGSLCQRVSSASSAIKRDMWCRRSGNRGAAGGLHHAGGATAHDARPPGAGIRCLTPLDADLRDALLADVHRPHPDVRTLGPPRSAGTSAGQMSPALSSIEAMRVLVVEDDSTISEFVAAGLRQEGYAVDAADNGVDGLEMARSERYDAAIVDVMLPRLDGLSLVAALRRARVSTPVLFLSARRSVDDRVQGLQTGGDDYLTKPFAFPELLARIQAITRRASGSPEP